MNRSDLTETVIGLDFYPGFDNYPRQPKNTCGQAVIASVLVYTGLIDRLPEMAKSPELTTSNPEVSILERVVIEHGPNWPIRNSISNRKVITRALSHYGVQYVEHMASPFRSESNAIARLLDALEQAHPCIVLLDLHPLKLGKPFTLHWAVVYGASEAGVRLSSWGRDYLINWDEFLNAWRVWFLTFPYHYYCIEIL